MLLQCRLALCIGFAGHKALVCNKRDLRVDDQTPLFRQVDDNVEKLALAFVRDRRILRDEVRPFTQT